MKTNTKGFTLIELLAVIVILAVIALIASPIILGIINNARESSQARSVENYASAVKNAYTTLMSKPGYMGEDIEIVKDKDNKWVAQTIPAEGSTKDAETETIKYSGSDVTCSEIKYEDEGYINMKGCKVAGSKKAFKYYDAPSTVEGSTAGGAQRDEANDTKE